jgi:hypothetical protein
MCLLLADMLVYQTAPVVVRILLSLPGLQRAPGNSGHIHKLVCASSSIGTGAKPGDHRFTQQVHGIDQTVFVDDDGKHTPFPASFMVQVGSRRLSIICPSRSLTKPDSISQTSRRQDPSVIIASAHV